jgi:hypothetical protein
MPGTANPEDDRPEFLREPAEQSPASLEGLQDIASRARAFQAEADAAGYGRKPAEFGVTVETPLLDAVDRMIPAEPVSAEPVSAKDVAMAAVDRDAEEKARTTKPGLIERARERTKARSFEPLVENVPLTPGLEPAGSPYGGLLGEYKPRSAASEQQRGRVEPRLLPRLIGLGGKKGAGKDAVADHLGFSYDFQKFGMSDALATALYTFNPWICLDFEGADEWALRSGFSRDLESRRRTPGAPIFERYQDIHDVVGYGMAKRIPEVRQALQTLGTEVGRDIIGENVWVDIMRRRISEVRESGVPVALTAIRFENERQMVLEEGGVLVWVERPQLVAHADLADSTGETVTVSRIVTAIDVALDTHASEVTLSAADFEHVIVNDGSIPDLWQKADALVRSLG